MDRKLFTKAVSAFAAGVIMVGVLVFIPAGTLNYWYGWLLMGSLFLPMLLLGTVLAVKSPDLLRKRLRSKEKESEQRQVVAFSALMFLAGFVLCGLSFRFGWMLFSKKTALCGAAVFLLGYGMYGEVMRENAYLSRTVEVQEGQKLIDTGLYGIVRHPMYFATVLMFVSIPVILGAPIALAIFLFYPLILVKRIRNEEEVLSRDLAGYSDYCKKVKYRMIPFVW